SVKEAGLELLDEGIYNFVLDNGAKFKICASPYTVSSQGMRVWGFGYKIVEDRL
ncbi:hypothetical protein BGZ60DRAFT_361733, partial [Tricladium varicosporioides]